MDVVVVVGNPKPRSRTLAVAEAVAGRVASITGGVATHTLDLCDYAADMFTWPHSQLEALGHGVATADVVIVATPTYKAAYTGLLKAFLDRYPGGGLAGVTAIPVMTGGSLAHSMAVDTTLRPLLVELGASVPTSGLFVAESQMSELGPVVDTWAERNLGILERWT
jgi:FMN reductase